MITAWRYISIVLAMSVSATSTTAAQITLAPSKDTSIYSESNNTNGGGEVLHVGTNQLGAVRRALLQFDIAGNVPAGATIDSVALALHLNDAGPAIGDRSVALHRLLAPWGDGTTGTGGATGGSGGGFFPANNDVTWNARFYSSTPPVPPLLSWTTAGGDFDPSSSDVLTFTPTFGSTYSWSGSGLVDDVQQWLDSPAQNMGWIVLNTTPGSGTLLRFDSLNRTVESFRPQLTVEFTPVPEPASVGLVLVGATIAFFIGRRQVRRAL